MANLEKDVIEKFGTPSRRVDGPQGNAAVSLIWVFSGPKLDEKAGRMLDRVIFGCHGDRPMELNQWRSNAGPLFFAYYTGSMCTKLIEATLASEAFGNAKV